MRLKKINIESIIFCYLMKYDNRVARTYAGRNYYSGMIIKSG